MSSFEDHRELVHLSEVEFAILETDGQLSVIESQKNQVEMPESLIIDGEINSEILKMMGKNEDWLKKKLRQHGVDDYHDVFYCILGEEFVNDRMLLG